MLSAAVALTGCNRSGETMNEPSGAERPAYESPSRSTNTPTPSTNDTGNTGVKTNGANSSSGAATTP